jgi:chemotaxis protein CheD
MNRRTVGIAGLKTGGPGGVLTAKGLGSCVGLAIWDRVRRRGVLAHIMLPHQSIARRRSHESPYKYADVAVPESVLALEIIGCRRGDLVAKIAGGASMFEPGHGEAGDIGARNVEAVVRLLAEAGIPVVASDVGGTQVRTVELWVDSGDLVVKSPRETPRTI